MIASELINQVSSENQIYICHNRYRDKNQSGYLHRFDLEINRKSINVRFNLLLMVFIEIMKHPNPVLVHFFDRNFYGIIKEIEFTDNGVHIPGLATSDFQRLLNVLSGYLQNDTLAVLNRKFVIDTTPRKDSLTDEIIEKIIKIQNKQPAKSRDNSILQKWSILSKLNMFEINFLLFFKYFPETIKYNENSDIIPMNYLLSDPFKMHTYCRFALKISKDRALKMILRKELNEFREIFRSQ